jgi:transposase-like protein
MSRQPTCPPSAGTTADPLARFACPNPDCALFNRFAADNLSVVEQIGKHADARRLYCTHCGHRFSEHQGTLLQYAKLPLVAVVRLIKCLAHGCSIEAAADICDVDPRTVERLLEAAGRRAEDFHRLRLDRLTHPPEAVPLDELHARVAAAAKKGGTDRPGGELRRGRIAAWVARGFMSRWR